MGYEKKYKEALEKARKWYNKTEPDSYTCIVESIFPELKESEDEQHRKWILEYLYDGLRKSDEQFKPQFESAIAWLEKQAEIKEINNDDLATLEIWEDIIKENKEKWQLSDWFIEATSLLIRKVKCIENNHKSKINIGDGLEKQGNKLQGKKALEAAKEEKVDNANKIEPKFHEGEWIIRNAEGFKHNTYLVKEVKDYYVCEELKGRRVTFTFNDVHKNFKLWDISDAKDGNVLYSSYCNLIWIYEDEKICHVGSNLNYNSGSIVINKPIYIPTDVQPATKEQRDLLEKTMAKAGYKWNSEEKRIMKVPKLKEPEGALKQLLNDENEVQDISTISHYTAWSEEDERLYRGLHNLIYSTPYCDSRKELSDFLDSLKNRVHSNLQQEWTEEDKKCIRLSTDIIDSALRAGFCVQLDRDRCVDWLKSLKERCTWKPSDKQLTELRCAISGCSFETSTLIKLEEDLKRLL